MASAATPTLEVPFVPQTDALCGGAAAAMVFRYWGDAHADAQQFASLIERHHGVSGIADTVLTAAVRARGWKTERTDGSMAGLVERIAARQPAIVLLSDRRDAFHYVVVVGADDSAIVVHDPSWGPSRSIARSEFSRRWAASRNWSLVILPASAPTAEGARADGSMGRPADECDAATSAAVAEIRAQGFDSFDRADEIFKSVQAQCPESAGPWRELAGVRFAQRRWGDASTLARQALDRQPGDEYATFLLGSSLFMQDDQLGALRAWNRIGQPRLDGVRIEGLRRSRYQAINDAIGLTPERVLTADAFLQARHRLDELPDRSSARLSLRPEDNGFASVDVVIVEQPGVPRGFAEWIGAAVRTGVDRELASTVPGFTGQGEVWSAGWRWWHNRPRVAVGFEAPRVGGLPGVWRVEGSWETETYAATDGAILQESRAHGGLTVSDWMTGQVRYSLSAGFDAWDTGQRAASVGGSLERRWLDDRLALDGRATLWVPGFNLLGARAVARSSLVDRGWVSLVTAGAERVSDAAPLTLWPGAGEGRARTPLLRAHPLLDSGVIDLTSGAVFGRSTVYGSAEVQRWLDRPTLTRVGFSAFVDIAQASRRATSGAGPAQTDVGGGVRVRLPGVPHVLRVDAAHGLRDGANAVTVGWMF
jgi:predicted double-glycine peptidase